ncbi:MULTISPECIES: hypothetical protein [Pseudomonas]|jgi:hypothetical protein|uniref:hypothetical protein n=1 Tax=Pseudomonas TaxID=286 RepID=UPI0018E7832A|nr:MULTISPECIES: hypothetical protein [Pseudomonas]MBJ2214108.1 hypothetical protein [Pseudomonas carnis]MBP5947976.1 hypothetical protein [Pseudomonas sp. P9(2020)]
MKPASNQYSRIFLEFECVKSQTLVRVGAAAAAGVATCAIPQIPIWAPAIATCVSGVVVLYSKSRILPQWLYKLGAVLGVDHRGVKQAIAHLDMLDPARERLSQLADGPGTALADPRRVHRFARSLLLRTHCQQLEDRKYFVNHICALAGASVEQANTKLSAQKIVGRLGFVYLVMTLQRSALLLAGVAVVAGVIPDILTSQHGPAGTIVLLAAALTVVVVARVCPVYQPATELRDGLLGLAGYRFADRARFLQRLRDGLYRMRRRDLYDVMTALTHDARVNQRDQAG